LSDSGLEGVQDTRVLALAGKPFESRVHFPRVLLGKLCDGTDAKAVEIAEHGGTNGNKVAELA
jgi:hypothetical protein